jgi:hypothetical protein
MSQLPQNFQMTSEGAESAGPELASEQGTLVEELVSETLEEVQVRCNNLLASSLTHFTDIGKTRGGRRA